MQKPGTDLCAGSSCDPRILVDFCSVDTECADGAGDFVGDKK